jgi:hypothetical protein
LLLTGFISVIVGAMRVSAKTGQCHIPVAETFLAGYAGHMKPPLATMSSHGAAMKYAVAMLLALVLVVVKYTLLMNARVGEAGQLISLTLSGPSAFYVNAFDLVYLPARSIVAALFEPLRLGGVLIDGAVDVVASVTQNAVALWIWRQLRRRRGIPS